MSDPYERVKGNRLTFKGGSVATSSKSIGKKKKKKQPKLDPQNNNGTEPAEVDVSAATDGSGGVSEYTIDAAKRMKYEQLFPVEAKKFGYNPKSEVKAVEDVLDDRVKKKADRYCK
ncbi:hypothetical protein UlMin_032480 [Ulmus minor]